MSDAVVLSQQLLVMHKCSLGNQQALHNKLRLPLNYYVIHNLSEDKPSYYYTRSIALQHSPLKEDSSLEAKVFLLIQYFNQKCERFYVWIYWHSISIPYIIMFCCGFSICLFPTNLMTTAWYNMMPNIIVYFK